MSQKEKGPGIRLFGRKIPVPECQIPANSGPKVHVFFCFFFLYVVSRQLLFWFISSCIMVFVFLFLVGVNGLDVKLDFLFIYLYVCVESFMGFLSFFFIMFWLVIGVLFKL